jgi:hypothetical protein
MSSVYGSKFNYVIERVSGKSGCSSVLPVSYGVEKETGSVTTDYVPPAMRALEDDVKVLNEIGLDPGIDHLYAVKTRGGSREARKGTYLQPRFAQGRLKVASDQEFFCGGLPEPECANNPWDTSSRSHLVLSSLHC